MAQGSSLEGYEHPVAMGAPRRTELVCAARFFYAERQKRKKVQEAKRQCEFLEAIRADVDSKCNNLEIQLSGLKSAVSERTEHLASKVEEIHVAASRQARGVVVEVETEFRNIALKFEEVQAATSQQARDVHVEVAADLQLMTARLDRLASNVAAYAVRLDESDRRLTEVIEQQAQCVEGIHSSNTPARIDVPCDEIGTGDSGRAALQSESIVSVAWRRMTDPFMSTATPDVERGPKQFAERGTLIRSPEEERQLAALIKIYTDTNSKLDTIRATIQEAK